MTIALISALPNELAALGSHFDPTEQKQMGGQTFRLGQLDGYDVVAVEAGIGKVNAAVTATLLCQEFGCRALIFSGVAGGLDPALKPGDVVIGRRVVCHDYGALIDGAIKPYQPGVPPLPGVDDKHGWDLSQARQKALTAAVAKADLPALSDKATGGQGHVPRIVMGTITTGDHFIADPAFRDRLHERTGAQAAEMEGAALHQVAERFGAEALVVRCLSDLAGADSAVSFTDLLDETAAVAATLVRCLIPVLAR